ncbi:MULTISPECIES: hypothetical protein [Cyanophyceae]|nr:hypothetical protein [Trichocoleus sp. FACHB-69]MBD1933384.1 hypothetical protein [Trichocoleus sp. FACHB-69]
MVWSINARGQGILLYLLMWTIVPQKKYLEIDKVKDASSVEEGTGEV